MGIDVYMRWKDQTEAERKAQFTGFSIEHGHVGYLREAYHGAPYATRVLVPEAFSDDPDKGYVEDLGVPYKAETLRARLEATLETAKERAQILYKEELSDDAPELKSFKNFVELAEKLEASGKQVFVEVSA